MGENITKWNNINLYIKNELSNKAYMFFDNIPYLGMKNKSHIAVYGGHPNEQGCYLWAEAFYEKIKHIIK